MPLMNLDIKQFQLYWVKLRGFSEWPAVVESSNEKGEFTVHFFGDYTKSSKLNSSRFLYNFKDGIIAFNEKPNPNNKLVKAVKEALLSYEKIRNKKPPTSCCICNYLNRNN